MSRILLLLCLTANVTLCAQSNQCNAKIMIAHLDMIGEGMEEMERALLQLDDGQPLVEVARRKGGLCGNFDSNSDFSKIQKAMSSCKENEKIIQSLNSLQSMANEINTMIRKNLGGKTVGSGVVTHILEKIVQAQNLVETIRREIQIQR